MDQMITTAEAVPVLTEVPRPGVHKCKDCPELTLTARAERCPECAVRHYRERERRRTAARRQERAARAGVVIRRYTVRDSVPPDPTDDGKDISDEMIERLFQAAKQRLKWERAVAHELREVMS